MIQESPDGVAPSHFRRAEAGPGDAPDEHDDAPAGEGAARSQLEEMAYEAERLVRDCLVETERGVRRHPLAAVGIAAGVGLLIGLVIGRGR